MVLIKFLPQSQRAQARYALELYAGRREVVDALTVAAMTVAVDEVGDRAFQITGQKVVFKQQFAFQREMSALDLVLRWCQSCSGYAG